MYDVIILGGGAGGLTAAIGLVSAGKKILLIEKENLGGECTWSGCIPSKSFISISKTALNLKDALEETRKKIYTIGDDELKHISNFKNLNLIKGEGKLINENTVLVNGITYTAKYIVISTGSSPFIPNIKGLDKIDYLTNQKFFYNKNNYKSITIIGAGIISLELAFPLKKLGIDVIILEKSNVFLPMMESEIRNFYLKKLSELGIKLILDCSSMEIEQKITKYNKKELLIKTNNGEFSSEEIFISTGRAPNISNLNLKEIGIDFNNKEITVDQYLRTSIKNIFAVGDVVSNLKFSHIAGYHGEIVVRNILFPFFKKKIDYSNIPWTIFGESEASSVGLTEEEAKKKYKKIYVYILDKNNDRSLISFEKYFFLKVVCDSKFNIIGVTCIGERAGEILGGIQIMIQNKIKFYKGINSIQAYPTYMYYVRNLCKKAYIDYLKSFLR